MQNWGRRIRAAIGMGLIWGAGWSGAGALLARIPGFDSDVPFALLFAPLGFGTGIIFSGIVAVIERRRRLDRMPLSRFAGWGAASGLLLTAIGTGVAALRGEASARDTLVFGLVITMASAACAAASLALARRAERRELADSEGIRQTPNLPSTTTGGSDAATETSE